MNKKILIVDDEKNIRMTLRHCLNEQGYEIDIAVNGEEAVRKIREESYDLALLDIKMPGLTGMQVLERIREFGSKIDIIMMTAYGTIEQAVKAMKLGAIDFISKPFSPNEIRAIVKDVLDRQELNEENITSFKDYVEYSKKCILQGEFNKAEEFLKSSIVKDINSPIPYNLLGVLAEYRGDIAQARKHYRVALDLDPTYKAAEKNLERTTQLGYKKVGMDMGDEMDEEI